MGSSDLIQHFNDDNFDDKIAHGVVLIDFFADWCGPCRMLTPVLEELAQKMQGKLVIGKIDTDESVQVAARFEVTSIPTLILFKDKQLVKRVVGLKDLDTLVKLVSEFI